jgi:hypothetical protein
MARRLMSSYCTCPYSLIESYRFDVGFSYTVVHHRDGRLDAEPSLKSSLDIVGVSLTSPTRLDGVVATYLHTPKHVQ